MLRTLHKGAVKIVPRGNAVHFSKEDALREDFQDGLVKIGRFQKTLRNGFRYIFVCFSALQVHAVLHSGGSGFNAGFKITVAAFHIEIVQRPAVAHNHTLEAPFPAEDVIHKIAVCAAGNAPEAVVGSHYLLYAGLGYKVLEGGKIGFTEVTLTYVSVKLMTVFLRAGMHGQMLGAGVEFLYR